MDPAGRIDGNARWVFEAFDAGADLSVVVAVRCELLDSVVVQVGDVDVAVPIDRNRAWLVELTGS